MQFCQSPLCLPATGGICSYLIGPDWCWAAFTRSGLLLRKLCAPSIWPTRSETVSALSYTFHPAKPMMPTATRITAVNIAIGPQLRPWLTLTGASGRRPPALAAGREVAAFAAGREPALVAPAFAAPALAGAFDDAPALVALAERPAVFDAAFVAFDGDEPADSSFSRFGLPPAVAFVADDRRDPPLCGVLMLMGLVRRGVRSQGLAQASTHPASKGRGAAKYGSLPPIAL